MREEHYFDYVTLACDDGHQIEAHKLILTASSPLFSISLKKEKYPHTLIYMQGMTLEELSAVFNFK